MLLASVRLHASGAESVFYYTFNDTEGGGVAAVRVHTNDARLTDGGVVARGGRGGWEKLAVSADGLLVAAVAPEGRPNLLVRDLSREGEGATRTARIPQEPDAIEAWGRKFVVGAGEGFHYLVDGDTARVEKDFNARRQLRPSGRKPEYILVEPGADTAWITFQKDSRTGSHKGSRVLCFDLANWRLLADNRLPRNMPALHMADLREQGPSPEIMVVSPASNTLLLSMDLYGGVAMADLDAARRGRWSNLVYLSTHPTGEWGTAFPDRALHFTRRGRDYVLMNNAGRDGGSALIDLEARRIVQIVPTPPGLEIPVWLPAADRLAAVARGKVKLRGPSALAEERAPRRELFVFAFEPGDEVRLRLETYQLDGYSQHTKAAGGPESDRVLALLRGAAGAGDQFVIISATNGETLARLPAAGPVARIAGGIAQ